MSTLPAALAELADEWERDWRDWDCLSTNTGQAARMGAAKRIRNLLAAHPAPATASEGGECPKNAECWQAGGPRQEAQHYRNLYEQASEGKCGHSGLTIGACKASICDCFEFPWVEPAPEEHPDPATANEDATEGCPMHGERETFTAPHVGYTKEPGCTCTVLPAAGVTSSDGDRGLSEDGWWSGKTIAEIIHEYAVVRGDLSEQYARDQLTSILAARIAAVRTRARRSADRIEAGE